MSKKVTCSQDPGKGKAGVLSLLFLSVCGRGMNLLKNQGLIYSQAAQRTEGLYRLGSSWILFHGFVLRQPKSSSTFHLRIYFTV